MMSVSVEVNVSSPGLSLLNLYSEHIFLGNIFFINLSWVVINCINFLHFFPDGFIFVDEILAHAQFSTFSIEDVEKVVATNDKQRFKLQNHPENGRQQIRANQGHSIQVCGNKI